MCGKAVLKAHYFGKRLDRPMGLRPELAGGKTISIYKCGHCKLIYPNPLPVPLSKSRYSISRTEEFWEERDTIHKEHFKYELGILKKLTGGELGSLSALDIGFGLGSSLATMNSVFKEVYGIEPYLGLFNKTLQNLGSAIDAKRLSQAGFEETEYGNLKFDFIFFEAVQHISDLNAGLRKAFDLLKPGGILYVEVPSSSYLFHRLVNLFYKIRRNGFVINTSPMHSNYSYYEFSVKSFSENGKQNGYRVIYDEVFVCKPPLKGIAAKLLIFLMKLTRTGMQRSIWLKKDEKV